MFWSIVSSMPHKQPRHSRHRRPLNKRASALQGAASRPTLPDPGEAGMLTGSDGSYHDLAFRHPFRVTADQQLMVGWLANFQQGAFALIATVSYRLFILAIRAPVPPTVVGLNHRAKSSIAETCHVALKHLKYFQGRVRQGDEIFSH